MENKGQTRHIIPYKHVWFALIDKEEMNHMKSHPSSRIILLSETPGISSQCSAVRGAPLASLRFLLISSRHLLTY